MEIPFYNELDFFGLKIENVQDIYSDINREHYFERNYY